MKPTDDLREEHTAIRLMLRILDGVCTDIEAERSVKLEHLEGLLEFMKIFVDKCHHTKEEVYLFPEMEKAGIPAKELIDSLIMEHKQGREHVSRIEEAVSRKVWDKEGLTILEDARAYIQLLTLHTEKEEKDLFPMADAYLAPEVQKELLDSFEVVENEEVGTGKHEEFHRLLHRLKEIYLMPEKEKESKK